MFTFKNINIVFIAILSVLFIGDIFFSVHWLSYFILAIVYTIPLAIGSSRISSGFYLKAICNAPTPEKKIAITFDDGPNKQITPEVLKLLNDHNIKATFFCIGKNIKENNELLLKMKSEGHLVGNHTYSHAFLFDFYLSSTVRKELKHTNEIIYNVIGKKPRYFRPPYGVTNPSISKAVKKTGFEVIGWNVRSLDTITNDVAKIVKRTTENLKGGDIVLFHDTHPRVIHVLKDFLKYTSENGFKIVPLDELIKISPYE